MTEHVVSKINDLEEANIRRKQVAKGKNALIRAELLNKQAQNKNEGKVTSFQHLSIEEQNA